MFICVICVNLSSLKTSNNWVFTDKGGDLSCFNISKHTCPVVKSSDEKFVFVLYLCKKHGLSFKWFY